MSGGRISVISAIASRGFIVVNKELLRVFGASAAVLLGELASEYDYIATSGGLTDDGFFYATLEKISHETGLSRKEQDTAIRTLCAADVLEVRRSGYPAKRYFRLNLEKIADILSTFTESVVNISDGENTQIVTKGQTASDCPKGANMFVPKGQTVHINNNNNNNNNNARKTEKKRYGEYNNVRLTADEFDKLCQLFPQDVDKRINALSRYLYNHKDKYKSHYKTILVWARNDEENTQRSAAELPPPIELE